MSVEERSLASKTRSSSSGCADIEGGASRRVRGVVEADFMTGDWKSFVSSRITEGDILAGAKQAPNKASEKTVKERASGGELQWKG